MAKITIPPPAHTLHSPRLDLPSMPAPFLIASLVDDRAALTAWLDAPPPDDWLGAQELMHLRLAQLRLDPSLQPWLLRAVILRETGEMIGHVTFHTAPNPDYLQPIAPGGIELGYTIYPPHRRQGYATEAVAALISWAEQAEAVHRFVLSISPANAASLAIAHHFGFQRVGAHEDETDGPEDIFILERNGTLEVQSKN